MMPFSHFAVRGITGVFLVGCVGALITIPIVAFRFVSVLFEHDPEEDKGAPQSPAA